MKRVLLVAFGVFSIPVIGLAQMFSPSASSLPDGDLNQPYVGQVINFTVEDSTTISGALVEQAIAVVYPQAAPVIGLLGLDSEVFDFIVTRTSLLVNGLPNGMTATCDATPCTYIANASGYITLSGIPTENGLDTIDIVTLTEGAADISSIGSGILSQLGIPSSFDLPAPVPGLLDEEGYTLRVNNTNGISALNEVYDLGVYPNPVEEIATLLVNSKVDDLALIEVYSVTGEMVKTESTPIQMGNNRIHFDMAGFPNGIYLIKMVLNGHQALVRIETV